jgi:hypothetical protein
MPQPSIVGIGGEIFSAVAEGAISGGALLQAGSYTSTVTNGSLSIYDYSKIKVSCGGSGLNCAGMALYDRASGTTNEVAVLRRGIVIVPANGAVEAGRSIEPSSAGADACVLTAANAGRSIGKGLTTAASGGYTIALLNI